MKIWHFGDSHTYHGLLDIPKNIDMIIFSGDATNPLNPVLNEIEMLNFLHWFALIDCRYKIMIAGNHDSSIEKNRVTKKTIEEYGIIYLENEEVIIEGIKIWGSPYCPTFGNWCFMKNRNKLDKIWRHIPEDTDILVTHTPPKGILDYSHDYNNYVERCGCSALMKRILNLNIKYHLFGHIHNNKDIINAGTMKLSILDTIFSNGSILTDGKFGKLTSNGNIINYKK